MHQKKESFFSVVSNEMYTGTSFEELRYNKEVAMSLLIGTAEVEDNISSPSTNTEKKHDLL